MEKLGEEIKRLNKNPEFVELMSEEEEYEKYINTEKAIEYKKGVTDKTKDIALNMLENHVDVELISKYTDLSIDEIDKLKTSNNN